MVTEIDAELYTVLNRNLHRLRLYNFQVCHRTYMHMSHVHAHVHVHVHVHVPPKITPAGSRAARGMPGANMPRDAYPGRSMRPCTLDELTHGRWVMSRAIAPYSSTLSDLFPRKYATTAFKSSASLSGALAPWEYAWRVDSDCSFAEFNASAWCARARHLLFVGDSLVHQAYNSLLGLLGGISNPVVAANNSDYSHSRFCTSSLVYVRMQDPGAGGVASFLSTSLNISHGSSDWSIEQWLARLGIHNSAAKGNRTGGQWAFPRFVSLFDVVVWNYGIFHLVQTEKSTRMPGSTDLESYRSAVGEIMDWFASHYRHASGLLIFQATTPAASGCICSEMPNDLASSLAGRCDSPFAAESCQQWSKIEDLNMIAWQRLSLKHGGRIMVLDMWHALVQRSDSHRGSSCMLSRGGCQGRQTHQSAMSCPKATDCLHWHLPGALDLLPRVYAHVLEHLY